MVMAISQKTAGETSSFLVTKYSWTRWRASTFRKPLKKIRIEDDVHSGSRLPACFAAARAMTSMASGSSAF